MSGVFLFNRCSKICLECYRACTEYRYHNKNMQTTAILSAATDPGPDPRNNLGIRANVIPPHKSNRKAAIEMQEAKICIMKSLGTLSQTCL